MKAWIIRIFLIAFSALPGACHFFLTGPVLWNHHTSSAFDLWGLIWFLSIVLVVVAIAATADKKSICKLTMHDWQPLPPSSIEHYWKHWGAVKTAVCKQCGEVK